MSNLFGLNPTDIQFIINILRSYPEIKKAAIFGSRAKGNHKNTSDIDIALYGSELEQIVLEISGKLNDESPFPYKVDVVDYSAIDNNHFKDHIDRIGIVFYEAAID